MYSLSHILNHIHHYGWTIWTWKESLSVSMYNANMNGVVIFFFIQKNILVNPVHPDHSVVAPETHLRPLGVPEPQARTPGLYRCLSISLCVRLFACGNRFICLFAFKIWIYLYIFLHLSDSLFICLSSYLSRCRSIISLQVYPFTSSSGYLSSYLPSDLSVHPPLLICSHWHIMLTWDGTSCKTHREGRQRED